MADTEQRRAGSHVLAWLVVAAVPAFAATAMVSRTYHAGERSLAREYRERGERLLFRGDSSGAADAFRTALTFARDDFELRYDLARALLSSHSRPEARAYLLALRDEQPGDGPVNLALGRLAIDDRDATSAIRYEHDAIEGAWPREPEEARRSARLELAEFLIREQLIEPAQAELIALAGDLPADPAFRERVGALLVDTGMPSRALPILRGIASSRPSAAAQAGRAAFALGDDTLAERYLAAARAGGSTDPSVADLLDVLRLSRDVDPFASQLSTRERLARCTRALDAALARVDACPAIPADAASAVKTEVEQLRRELARARTADPDLLARTLQLVSRADASGDTCGPATPQDRALVRVARRHQGGAS